MKDIMKEVSEVEDSLSFLLDITVILFTTKIFGVFSKKLSMPQVVGALLAGIIFGPSVLNILHETSFIDQMSELGVLILMFSAGLETDIPQMKQTGKTAFLVAMCGVLVPLIVGAGVGYAFIGTQLVHSDASSSLLLQSIFIGVILTATSVSISVETLRELGKFNSPAGSAIMAAAIIDDVLGIIALTVISSFAGSDVSIGWQIFKMVIYFVLVGAFAFYAHKYTINYAQKVKELNLPRFTIVGVILCFLMAYITETVFGVADITGAYIAGAIFANTAKTDYMDKRIESLSYLLLSPVFFASIGIKANMPAMSGMLLLFAVVIVITAILTKVVGCGIGARISGYSSHESIQIGVGMVARGEVVLIIASKGESIGLLSSGLFGPIILIVVVTAVATPIMLKRVFHREKRMTEAEKNKLSGE